MNANTKIEHGQIISKHLDVFTDKDVKIQAIFNTSIREK